MIAIKKAIGEARPADDDITYLELSAEDDDDVDEGADEVLLFASVFGWC